MRQPLVAGNWKMNGTQAFAEKLVDAVRAGVANIANVDMVLCPAFILLPKVIQVLGGISKGKSKLAWGGQNLSQYEDGAYTGEVSATMLADCGCEYVIVGHSERREYFAEDNALVAAKALMALHSGLKPIICVGESLAQRESGDTETVVREQLAAVLNLLPLASLPDIVIAYEPVWAIGTGLTASPAQAQSVHAHIREQLRMADAGAASAIRVLYGGSVKADNAHDLFSQTDIDGGLIGGASLSADDFIAICQAANQGNMK